MPRAGLLKRRGTSRLSAAPTPNSSPQFSRAPYPINVQYPSQSCGPGVSPSVHSPSSDRPVCAQDLYQANPISTQLSPVLGQSTHPTPLPAQPTRDLKPAGEWAQGGPSTQKAWPIGDCAWPRQQPIDVERGAAAERSGPNIPPPSSLPPSPSLQAAVHLLPPFLLSPSATRAPARSELPPGSLPRRQRSSCRRRRRHQQQIGREERTKGGRKGSQSD